MSYDKDAVVEEVRKVREKIMKEFDFDPHAFGKYLAERENKRRYTAKAKQSPRRRQIAIMQ